LQQAHRDSHGLRRRGQVEPHMRANFRMWLSLR
jgi:hypothetical protein